MWLIVGHGSQVPRPGSQILYEFDKDSIIAVRDNEGRIRARYNVYRHRAPRICAKDVGVARVLTCLYHAWSYGLDGRLLVAAYTPGAFDKTLYPLISCYIRVHHGFIFLCFANEPPDFDAFVQLLTRELEMQDLLVA